MTRAITATCLGLALVGCSAVGPDYEGPPAGNADTLSTWPSAAESDALIEPAEPPADWWAPLDDEILDTLIDRAIESNFDLRVAVNNVRAGRAVLQETDTRRRPSIDLNGRVQERRDSSALLILADADDRFPTVSTASFSLDLAWELDLFGRVRRSIEAAVADLGSLEAVRRAVTTSVIADVALNYIELRGAQMRVDVAVRNVDLQNQTLALVELLQAEGAATELDVARARTQLLTSQSSIPTLEAAARGAANRLSTLTGAAPGALQPMLERAEFPALPEFVAAGNPVQLLRRRADLHAAERRLAGAVARIGISTADLYPTVRFGGVLGVGGAPLSNFVSRGAPFFSLGPALEWNLFDRSAVYARIEQSDARAAAALAAFEGAVTTALEEVDSALNAWHHERKRRALLAEAHASSLRSAELARLRYREGVEDFLTVLDAERNQILIEDRLARSRIALAQRVVQIYRALGGGWQVAEAAGDTP